MHMRNKAILTLLLAASLLAGCKQGAPVHDSGAEALVLSLRQTVIDGKTLFGHQDDNVCGVGWRAASGDDFERSDVFDACGKRPALVEYELGGIESGDSLNICSCSFESIRQAALDHYSRGGVVSFIWSTGNLLTGGDVLDTDPGAVKAVLKGGSCHAQFMESLAAVADFLGSLKTPSGEPMPVIWRPYREHTAAWFWWGQDSCTPAEFAEMWRMTYRYLVRERGLKNLLWAYSPNVGVWNMADYLERYPGDGYVDIVGFDCYEKAERTFENDAQWYGTLEESDDLYVTRLVDGLAIIFDVARANNKIPALTECGFVGIKSPHWWQECLYDTIDMFPLAYCVVGRNDADDPEQFHTPYAGFDGNTDFAKFIGRKKIVML